jgi:hypothetical protein
VVLISLVCCTTLKAHGEVPSEVEHKVIETDQKQTPSTQVNANEDESVQPTWFDNWHSSLTDSMDFTAQQLDEFFALEGSDEHDNARAEGRIRIGWEPRSRNLDETELRFKVRVQLPALQDRVDILLSDDEEYNQDNSIKAARDSETNSTETTSLALRFQKDKEAKLSHRIGIGRRDQLFAKSDFKDEKYLTPQLKLSYDAELYYYTRDRLGAELGIRFQQALQEDQYLRFNNRYYFRDKTNDWRWRHEIQYLRPLTSNSATIYTLFTEGLTTPNYQLSEVYTSMRWRANPMRDWLYFEVEPFVVWLRTESFSASYGIAFRLELYYGKDS